MVLGKRALPWGRGFDLATRYIFSIRTGLKLSKISGLAAISLRTDVVPALEGRSSSRPLAPVGRLLEGSFQHYGSQWSVEPRQHSSWPPKVPKSPIRSNRGLVRVCGVLMGRVFFPWFGVVLGAVDQCAKFRCDICCGPATSVLTNHRSGRSQQSGSGVRMRRLDGSGLFALVRGRPGCGRSVCQVQM